VVGINKKIYKKNQASTFCKKEKKCWRHVDFLGLMGRMWRNGEDNMGGIRWVTYRLL
jgi:hypothetical protein